jgi:hypothetical protein
LARGVQHPHAMKALCETVSRDSDGKGQEVRFYVDKKLVKTLHVEGECEFAVGQEYDVEPDAIASTEPTVEPIAHAVSTAAAKVVGTVRKVIHAKHNAACHHAH